MMDRGETKTFEKLGKIDLNDIYFSDESLEVFLTIDSISEALIAEVEKAIEESKQRYINFRTEYCKERGKEFCKCWSDDGVNMTYIGLRVTIMQKKVDYMLFVTCEDKIDNDLECSADIHCDLSEYDEEIKKIILKSLVKQFF